MLYNAAKHRAKEKGLTFDLTEDWIYQKLLRKCELTGLSFFLSENERYNRHALTPSVDRINQDLGYTKDNCRLIIWWVNLAKQKYSDLELWHLCSLVIESLDANGVPAVKRMEEIPVVII